MIGPVMIDPWRGIATYLNTHSNAEMYAIWAELRERFSASIWARRIP
jgi:hypothetical protein